MTFFIQYQPPLEHSNDHTYISQILSFSYIFDTQEFEQRLANVKSGKAPGPDGIASRMLRDLSSFLATTGECNFQFIGLGRLYSRNGDPPTSRYYLKVHHQLKIHNAHHQNYIGLRPFCRVAFKVLRFAVISPLQ